MTVDFNCDAVIIADPPQINVEQYFVPGATLSSKSITFVSITSWNVIVDET